MVFIEVLNVLIFFRLYFLILVVIFFRMSFGEGDRVRVLFWGLFGLDGTDMLLFLVRYLYFCSNNIIYYFYKI